MDQKWWYGVVTVVVSGGKWDKQETMVIYIPSQKQKEWKSSDS